jgi:hypothetical protein
MKVEDTEGGELTPQEIMFKKQEVKIAELVANARAEEEEKTEKKIKPMEGKTDGKPKQRKSK